MTYDTAHNSLFLKVVWRGHLGVAAAKSARTFSTGKESVSDKREFLEFVTRKCSGGFSPLFYNFQNYAAFISFCSIGLILMYRLQ